ncbi:MAG: DUF975 family protein [Lachnospiraceae bacterium]|nr:DUF975 family protein [Lachnospiraceae bacterium]
MKSRARDYKRRARIMLDGHWSTAACLMLLLAAYSWSASSLSAPLLRQDKWLPLLTGGAILLILVMIKGLLKGGVSRFFLAVSRNEKAGIGLLFSCFKLLPDRFLILEFIFSLLTVAYTLPPLYIWLTGAFNKKCLVLLILWAVFGSAIYLRIRLSFLFSRLILADEPGTGVLESLKRSSEMTNGCKWSLFLLFLSFTGYYLLSALSLFLGALWVNAYVEDTKTLIYLELAGSVKTEPE